MYFLNIKLQNLCLGDGAWNRDALIRQKVLKHQKFRLQVAACYLGSDAYLQQDDGKPTNLC